MNKTILFSISAATLGLCALVGLSKQTPMEAKAGTGPTSGSISSKQTINLKDNTESEIRSYYSALNGLDASELQGENLLKNLKPILQDFTYYTYDNVWKIYEITDREWSLSPASDTTYGTYDSTNNRIVDYQYGSNSNQKNNPWIHTLYRNRDENNVTIESGRIKEWAYDGMDSNKIHSQTGGTNREHVWCQSRGFKAPKGAEGPAGTDVHHLISGDGYVNGTPHNNNPYGFVDRSKSYTDSAASYAYCAGNYAGKALNPHSEDVSTTVFEPQDSDKGDIARACFYMVACYNNLAGLTGVISDYNPNLTMADYATDSGNSEASSDTHAVNMGILSDLLEWHRMDPVDDYEIHRNNLIYNNYQRNRNPFIDFPEWVDFIWGKASFNESTHKVISYDPTPTGSADPTKDAVGGYNAPTPVDPDEPSNLYEKATSIEAGDVVSFVYEGGQIALSSFSSNYATGTAVEIDDGRFLSENALAFTVEDGSLLGTYAFSK
ncbi:MAG: endonuclease, partial [Bacilli bacterium]|nr:endonuclease [Bacilli bacterium]